MVKEIHYKENTLFDIDPKVKEVMVTQNVAQYPRHHVTYATAKFDVATFHGYGEDAFTRKYIMKRCQVPGTLCDIYTSKA